MATRRKYSLGVADVLVLGEQTLRITESSSRLPFSADHQTFTVVQSTSGSACANAHPRQARATRGVSLPAERLDGFALRRERPQLIVTELRARDLTLEHLFARLRCDETTRCIPVMVLTTCCDQHALMEAKTAGAAAVLPKLADFGLLKRWVTALCG
jgi:hypothetical protein